MICFWNDGLVPSKIYAAFDLTFDITVSPFISKLKNTIWKISHLLRNFCVVDIEIIRDLLNIISERIFSMGNIVICEATLSFIALPMVRNYNIHIHNV